MLLSSVQSAPGQQTRVSSTLYTDVNSLFSWPRGRCAIFLLTTTNARVHCAAPLGTINTTSAVKPSRTLNIPFASPPSSLLTTANFVYTYDFEEGIAFFATSGVKLYGYRTNLVIWSSFHTGQSIRLRNVTNFGPNCYSTY